MLRVLPVLIALVLAVYCLVDVVQRPAYEVRYLPRWAWGVIILIAPIVGPVGYLVTGRPPNEQQSSGQNAAPGRPTPGSRSTGSAPDDDPEFLSELHRRHQREEEQRLRRWQEELEAREREIQQRFDDEDGNGKGPASGRA